LIIRKDRDAWQSKEQTAKREEEGAKNTKG